MPYKGWYNKKPNVSHLCEFGAPVWILLQGQKIDWKMQHKSKQGIYVGFYDGAGAVKYYNAEICNVLTSQNSKQIIPLQTAPTPKDVDIMPDSWPEEESDGDVLPTGITGSDDITLILESGSGRKHKRNSLEGDIDINALWKTCGIHINYKDLHDPYPEEENENNFLTMKEVYAIIAGDKLMSFKDTKNSPD